MEEKSKLILSTDYPHELLLHLGELIRKNGKKILTDREKFEKEYCNLFPKDTDNLEKMQLAFEQGIVQGFLEKEHGALWERNTFLKMSLIRLQKMAGENCAVQILESLMYIFKWNYRLEVERIWETEEDVIDFHKADRLKRGSMGLKELSEINDRQEEDRKEQTVSTSGSLKVTEKKERKEPGRIRKKETEKKERPVRNTVREKEHTIEDAVVPAQVQIPAKIKYEEKMSISQRKTVKKACNGKADAQCELGDFYLEEGTDHLDYNEAERWYLLSSKQGYMKASFQLGKLYNSGKGNVKDPEREALKYFWRLADDNYPTAQCILGIKYQYGQGVEMDIKKAMELFKKAAAQGYTEAQRRLGDLYSGLGDEEQASRWYRMAGKGGDSYSLKQLRKYH